MLVVIFIPLSLFCSAIPVPSLERIFSPTRDVGNCGNVPEELPTSREGAPLQPNQAFPASPRVKIPFIPLRERDLG